MLDEMRGLKRDITVVRSTQKRVFSFDELEALEQSEPEVFKKITEALDRPELKNFLDAGNIFGNEIGGITFAVENGAAIVGLICQPYKN